MGTEIEVLDGAVESDGDQRYELTPRGWTLGLIISLVHGLAADSGVNPDEIVIDLVRYQLGAQMHDLLVEGMKYRREDPAEPCDMAARVLTAFMGAKYSPEHDAMLRP